MSTADSEAGLRERADYLNKKQCVRNPQRPFAKPWPVDESVPGEVRLLVACMPKSGSTFLSKSIAQLPGMRIAHLVPEYKRREQELCRDRLLTEIVRSEWTIENTSGNPPYQGYVAQHHVRFSDPTAEIMREFRLKPVVLVRNIFDIVFSLRDHFINQSAYMPMAYVSEEMRNWPEERMHPFIVDMILPWYLNFFRNWCDYEEKLLVRYEDMLEDTASTLRKIADHIGVQATDAEIEFAFTTEPRGGTRKNKAVAGRGAHLAPDLRARIRRLADYYPDTDFSPIGL